MAGIVMLLYDAALLDVVYLAVEMLVILRDVNVLAVSLSRFSFTQIGRAHL